MELAKWQYLDWHGLLHKGPDCIKKTREGRTTNAEFLKADDLEK